MALITCKECGKEISDKSPNCINCGCPTNFSTERPTQEEQLENEVAATSIASDLQIESRTKSSPGVYYIIALIAIICIVVVVLSQGNTPTQTATVDTAQTEQANTLEPLSYFPMSKDSYWKYSSLITAETHTIRNVDMDANNVLTYTKSIDIYVKGNLSSTFDQILKLQHDGSITMQGPNGVTSTLLDGNFDTVTTWSGINTNDSTYISEYMGKGSISITIGTFNDCIVIKHTSTMNNLEHSMYYYYAKDVGLVAITTMNDGKESVFMELIDYKIY